MTAMEVINRVDGQLHNVASLEDKLEWLSQAEAMVHQLLARTGAPGKEEAITAQTQLAAPQPHDRLYGHYLEAQIHYASQEYLKYNNAMSLFQMAWMEYANALQRGSQRPGRRKFF